MGNVWIHTVWEKESNEGGRLSLASTWAATEPNLSSHYFEDFTPFALLEWAALSPTRPCVISCRPPPPSLLQEAHFIKHREARGAQKSTLAHVGKQGAKGEGEGRRRGGKEGGCRLSGWVSCIWDKGGYAWVSERLVGPGGFHPGPAFPPFSLLPAQLPALKPAVPDIPHLPPTHTLPPCPYCSAHQAHPRAAPALRPQAR